MIHPLIEKKNHDSHKTDISSQAAGVETKFSIVCRGRWIGGSNLGTLTTTKFLNYSPTAQDLIINSLDWTTYACG